MASYGFPEQRQRALHAALGLCVSVCPYGPTLKLHSASEPTSAKIPAHSTFVTVLRSLRKANLFLDVSSASPGGYEDRVA